MCIRDRIRHVDNVPSPKLTILATVDAVALRTGTTLLHNLFASNPANRAIRLWEMQDPFATSDEDIAKAIEEMRGLVEAAYHLAPRLKDIHPLQAEWPDECSWLFRNSFASMIHGFSYFIPGYVAWMLARDMGEDYRYYRKQLQAILSLRSGNPLVLKDPCHTWHIPELLATFSGARIIQLHRNPREVVPSFISLCQTLQEGESTLRPRPEGALCRTGDEVFLPGACQCTTVVVSGKSTHGPAPLSACRFQPEGTGRRPTVFRL